MTLKKFSVIPTDILVWLACLLNRLQAVLNKHTRRRDISVLDPQAAAEYLN